ncbi:hypothetical protein EQ827_08670, partial [Lactobacillus bombi]|nr:hypothetical protein [Bombilactobacillus bombi]
MAAKKRTRKKTTKKKKTANYTINISGLILIFVSIFAGLKLGLVGRFCANIYRILVGNGFEILAIVLIILGIVMFFSGKIPRIGWKRNLGLLLLIVSILAIMQAILFQRLALNNDILGVSWRLLVTDLKNSQVATDVGGGMLGAFLFSVAQPLFSLIGTVFVSCILAVVGLLMFCDVQLDQVIQLGQQGMKRLQAVFLHLQELYV